MRLIACCLAAVVVLPSTTWADGGVCVIPNLTIGIPTEVAVEDITKGFCGAARINNKIIRIDQVAARKIEGPLSCAPNNGECWKRVEYYLSEADWAPYVVILKGPKSPTQG